MLPTAVRRLLGEHGLVHTRALCLPLPDPDIRGLLPVLGGELLPPDGGVHGHPDVGLPPVTHMRLLASEVMGAGS